MSGAMEKLCCLVVLLLSSVVRVNSFYYSEYTRFPENLIEYDGFDYFDCDTLENSEFLHDIWTQITSNCSLPEDVMLKNLGDFHSVHYHYVTSMFLHESIASGEIVVPREKMHEFIKKCYLVEFEFIAPIVDCAITNVTVSSSYLPNSSFYDYLGEFKVFMNATKITKLERNGKVFKTLGSEFDDVRSEFVNDWMDNNDLDQLETIPLTSNVSDDVIVNFTKGFKVTEVEKPVTRTVVDFCLQLQEKVESFKFEDPMKVSQAKEQIKSNNFTGISFNTLLKLVQELEKTVDEDVSTEILNIDRERNSFSDTFDYTLESKIKDVASKRPSISKIATTTFFSSLTSLGLTTAISSGSFGKKFQLAGMGFMAIGSIGQTFNQISSIFSTKIQERDRETEYWVNYKEFVSDDNTGVRTCISHKPEPLVVNVGYRSMLKNSTFIWTDSVPSEIVFNDQNYIPKSRLFAKCFTGNLKCYQMNVKSYSKLIATNDEQKVWELAIYDMLQHHDKLEFTCGHEIMLTVRREKRITKPKHFIPEVFAGEPVELAYAEHDVCDKFPLKKVMFSLDSCSYNPTEADFGVVGCSELMSMSQYDEDRQLRYTVSDFVNQNTNKVFIFKNTTFDWVFSPYSNLNHSFLCKEKTHDFCSWSDFLLQYSSEYTYVRKFNVSIKLETDDNKFGFSFACPNKMRASYENNVVEITEIDNNVYVSSKKPFEPFFINCVSTDGKFHSDGFYISHDIDPKNRVEFVSHESLNLDLTNNYGLFDSSIYGKPTEFKFPVFLGEDNWDKIRNQVDSFSWIRFSFGKSGLMYLGQIWVPNNNKKTANANVDPIIELPFKRLTEGAMNADCTLQIRPYEEMVYVICPEGAFEKARLAKTIFELYYETSPEYCNANIRVESCTVKDAQRKEFNIYTSQEIFHPIADAVSGTNQAYIGWNPNIEIRPLFNGYMPHRGGFITIDDMIASDGYRKKVITDLEDGQRMIRSFTKYRVAFRYSDDSMNLWCCGNTTNFRPIEYKKPIYGTSLVYVVNFNPTAHTDRVNISSDLVNYFEEIEAESELILNKKSSLIQNFEKFKNLGFKVDINIFDVLKDYSTNQKEIAEELEALKLKAWNLYKKIRQIILEEDKVVCCHIVNGVPTFFGNSRVMLDDLNRTFSCEVYTRLEFQTLTDKIFFNYMGVNMIEDIDYEQEYFTCFNTQYRKIESREDYDILQKIQTYFSSMEIIYDLILNIEQTADLSNIDAEYILDF
ncbi:putative membrane-associated glycoprotein [Carp edema virus]|nr:putative membrane-associated glycoprotein [Carp edema virus]